MSDLVERLAKRRRRVLRGFAFSFIAWQAATLASVANVAEGRARLVDAVTVGAFVIWAAFLVAMLVFAWNRTGDAGVDAALEDELTRDNRRRAFVAGYWGTLAATAFLFGLSLFVDFTAAEGLRIVIAVAVAAPLLRFAALERPVKDA